MAHNFEEQYKKWDSDADRLLEESMAFDYDKYKNGEEYKGLETDYTNRGNQAMENTLAQVSARTGGLASSYATRAANNSFNDYMGLLEETARNIYSQRLADKQNAAQLARNTADDYYSRWQYDLQNQPKYTGGGGSGSGSGSNPIEDDTPKAPISSGGSKVDVRNNIAALVGQGRFQDAINYLYENGGNDVDDLYQYYQLLVQAKQRDGKDTKVSMGGNIDRIEKVNPYYRKQMTK